MRTVTIQQNHQVPIPTDLLKRLRWKTGRTVYVYPLEDGVTIRSKPSHVMEAAQEFEAIMRAEGMTLDDLLKGVAEQRTQRYQRRKEKSKLSR